MLLLLTAMALYGPVPPSSIVRSPDSVPAAEEPPAWAPPSATVPAMKIPSAPAVIPNATIFEFTIRSFLSNQTPIMFLAAKSNNRQQWELRLCQSICQT